MCSSSWLGRCLRGNRAALASELLPTTSRRRTRNTYILACTRVRSKSGAIRTLAYTHSTVANRFISCSAGRKNARRCSPIEMKLYGGIIMSVDNLMPTENVWIFDSGQYDKRKKVVSIVQ